jgi:hypothetical protein
MLTPIIIPALLISIGVIIMAVNYFKRNGREAESRNFNRLKRQAKAGIRK